MGELQRLQITCQEVKEAKLESQVCAYDCSRPDKLGITCKGNSCECPTKPK